MRFVSYNIQYGLGQDKHTNLARIASEVEGADVIALQEVERFWERSGMRDQPAELAAMLSDYYWVYGAAFDMNADTVDSNGRPVHRRRQLGNMLLSRTPILSTRTIPFPKFGTLKQHSIQHGCTECVIAAGDAHIRVHSLKFCHLSSATRLPQVDFLLDLHRRAPADGGAWCGGHPDPSAGWTEGEMPPMPRSAVFMGDLNCTVGSSEYERLVGPMSPRFGRLNNTDGLVDAWVAAGNDEEAGASTDHGPWRIDYCLVTPDLATRVTDAWINSDARGSDHYPVWTEIDL